MIKPIEVGNVAGEREFMNMMSKTKVSRNRNLGTGNLCFIEVYFTSLHCCEEPTLIPVFISQQKSEENFAFIKKGEQQK